MYSEVWPAVLVARSYNLGVVVHELYPALSCREPAVKTCLSFALVFLFAFSLRAAPAPSPFECLVLSEHFHSEGADFADINGDGHNDVVSGPFWYEGPEFRKRHRYMSGEPISIKTYSKHFFSFTYDLNQDRRPDILIIGMPGQPARWFENPGKDSVEAWPEHFAFDDAGGESPTFADLTGDGKPEVVCVHGGAFAYAEPNWKEPSKPWRVTPIMKPRGLGIFTHGMGVADVDGDGRNDVLETEGWHQQQVDGSFKLRRQKFAQAGGAQMFAYDFDGDGDNDVLAVQNAHAYGLTWFERRGSGDDFLWVPHEILADSPQQDRLSISQMHGVALEDMDGDGVKDIVTGKRYFAHGGGDPGAFQSPVLYWFRTVRDGKRVQFQPQLIHQRFGVGTQCTTGDIDGDGRMDVVIGNKLGTFVALNRIRPNATLPVTSVDASAKHSAAGTEDFQRGVRETEPLTPDEELASFVVPEGFEVQLVAAEPQINKPLNMAFDASGRLWVTSTVEYPYPAPLDRPARDSIKILEDKNGDGRAETVTTFADGLNIPIGLYPYGDGVICHSIPNIWYLRDTDGDGKCDKREVLYGPFDYSRDAHGMCNGFRRGFDGWLYACHGFNNQSQVSGADGNEVTMHSGNTFRMRLDGQRIEHFTHGQVNPFGLSFDRRGDLFSADCHTKPVTLLMKDGYYESFGKPHDGLGFVPNVMEHLHGSTAIGGIAITGENSDWPEAFHNSTFGGNVMTSRVNRNSLHYDGATVQAREEPDFVVSGDSWFRPADLRVGPDGALYIADFYNRIIGHYEVDLEHPGRDRLRGRIWRVVYKGSSSRRDTTAEPAPAAADLTAMSPQQLVEGLQTDNLTRRMLITDRLADHHQSEAIEPCRSGLGHSSADVRVHSACVLHRLNALTDADIEKLVDDPDAIVRAHVYRLLGERAIGRRVSALIEKGLRDASPLVTRTAAVASTSHEVPYAVATMANRWNETSKSDVHLRHALRLALRTQLQDEDVFRNFTRELDPAHTNLIAGICLALKTPAAGDFVVNHIDALTSEGQERLTAYIQFAARYVSPHSVPKVVELCRTSFGDDTHFQLQLLNSVANGLRQSNQRPPTSVKTWAQDLAQELIAFNESSVPLAWTETPHPEVNDPRPTWVVSNKRNLANGQKAVPLWSSFPNGEQRTAIFRSEPFKLPSKLEFYIAGHDGYPEQELELRNLVRLRDASSHDVIKQWSPPRNDMGQLQSWNPGGNVGREAYVELVDGDDAGAFAWIAVGHFSEPRLNPSDLLEDRRLGMQLVSDFKLTSLRTPILQLLNSSESDKASCRLAAKTMATLDGTAKQAALAESLSIPNLPHDLERTAIRLLTSSADDSEYWGSAMKFAASTDQRKIGIALASDQKGIATLLKMIDTGLADASILRLPMVSTNISSIGTEGQRKRIAEVIASLPNEDESTNELIKERKAAYVKHGGDRTVGAEIFRKSCAACHQVAGQGKQVGPNLDGIGNRGLDRLLEDVLAPNRNIDVNFHATTIVTSDGRAITGFLKPASDALLTLIETTGKEWSIAKSDVEDRSTSRLSPMPTNFGQVLSVREFRNLTSYLLSLTH